MITGKSNKRYSVKEDEYHEILSICQSILTDHVDVIFAYIHGSFLGIHNFGDVDLAVYLQGVKKEEYLELEEHLKNKIKKRIAYPIDVKVLNDSPPSFRYSVIKNGIRLVDKDENKRVNFETMTFTQYFDFLPFRRRYLKEALEGEI